MRGFGLFLSNNFGPFRGRPHHNKKRKPHASSGDALVSKSLGSYFQRVQGLRGPLKAALTSGVLSSAGDLLAQTLLRQEAQSKGTAPDPYEIIRTLRMFGFGFFWYGPFQFYWYNLLDWALPIKNTVNFISKVSLNQLILAPFTLTAVFTWTLAWQGRFNESVDKIKRDLWPTMINGWKFWVPAASINFYFVPLQHQVLYMSCCGVLWTAYLSYASTTTITAAPGTPTGFPSQKSSKHKNA